MYLNNNMVNNDTNRIKCVLLGDENVGKTSQVFCIIIKHIN